MDNKKGQYDVASISRPGKTKRANYLQDASHIEKKRTNAAGQFVKIFADMILTRTAGKNAYV